MIGTVFTVNRQLNDITPITTKIGFEATKQIIPPIHRFWSTLTVVYLHPPTPVLSCLVLSTEAF